MDAPIVVFGVGNPDRGDDALGPALARRLEQLAPPGVQVIEDYQLQVEHALSLEGRRRAVFVDAGTGTPAPYELRPAHASARFLHTTHALPPEAVLEAYERFAGQPAPESWVLCVRGESFGLGQPLTPQAQRNLDAAWLRLVELCGADPPAVDDPGNSAS
jgi:hydrogenase maturation protease